MSMTDLHRVRTIQKTSKALKLHVIVAYLLVLAGVIFLTLASFGPLMMQDRGIEEIVIGPWTYKTADIPIELLLLGGAVLGFGFFYRGVVAVVGWWHHG